MLLRFNTYSFPSLPPPTIKLVPGTRSGPLVLISKLFALRFDWLYGANQSTSVKDGPCSFMKHELQSAPPEFLLNVPLPVMKYTFPFESTVSPWPDCQIAPP